MPLTDDQRYVLGRRAGIGCDPYTWAEIGRKMEKHHEWVKRRHAEGIRIIKSNRSLMDKFL